jgi:hypothetical protein
MLAIFVMFIFIMEIGSGLDSTCSKLFYDGAEISRITSIYDVFVKSGVIYDT